MTVQAVSELQSRLAALRSTGVTGIDNGESPHDGAPLHVGSTPTTSTRLELAPRANQPEGDRLDQGPSAPSDRHRARRMGDVAVCLLDALANTQGRWKWGLRDIDLWTRGIGPGELCFITGRSYSGKTNLFLNTLRHNDGRPVMIVTMDEPAEHVLAKLYTLETGESFEVIEEQVKAKDELTMRKVLDFAASLEHILVFDDVYSFEGLDSAIKQFRMIVGEPAVVFVDYLGLLTGDTEEAFVGTENKAKALKRWAQVHEVPVVAVHQGTRTNSGKGQKLTLDSMAYAGENEAFHVIGVRRLRDEAAGEQVDRDMHEDTVNVSVVKSKRLPMRRGEKTYHLDPQSGLVRELKPGELDMRVRTYEPLDAERLFKAVVEQQGTSGQTAQDTWADERMF